MAAWQAVCCPCVPTFPMPMPNVAQESLHGACYDAIAGLQTKCALRLNCESLKSRSWQACIHGMGVGLMDAIGLMLDPIMPETSDRDSVIVGFILDVSAVRCKGKCGKWT